MRFVRLRFIAILVALLAPAVTVAGNAPPTIASITVAHDVSTVDLKLANTTLEGRISVWVTLSQDVLLSQRLIGTYEYSRRSRSVTIDGVEEQLWYLGEGRYQMGVWACPPDEGEPTLSACTRAATAIDYRRPAAVPGIRSVRLSRDYDTATITLKTSPSSPVTAFYYIAKSDGRGWWNHAGTATGATVTIRGLREDFEAHGTGRYTLSFFICPAEWTRARLSDRIFTDSCQRFPRRIFFRSRITFPVPTGPAESPAPSSAQGHPTG